MTGLLDDRTLVAIDTNCTACGLCLITCPDDVLVRAPKRPDVTGPCCGCLACIEVCPVDAFSVVDRSLAAQIVAESTGIRRPEQQFRIGGAS